MTISMKFSTPSETGDDSAGVTGSGRRLQPLLVKVESVCRAFEEVRHHFRCRRRMRQRFRLPDQRPVFRARLAELDAMLRLAVPPLAPW
jgi:hypothetical protein